VKEVVLQPCTNCGMGEIPFAVQLLLVGTAFLVVEVNALAFDPLKLVVLCAECVYVS